MKIIVGRLRDIIGDLEMLDEAIRNNCRGLEPDKYMENATIRNAMNGMGDAIDRMENEIQVHMKTIYNVSLKLGSDGRRMRQSQIYISLPE